MLSFETLFLQIVNIAIVVAIAVAIEKEREVHVSFEVFFYDKYTLNVDCRILTSTLFPVFVSSVWAYPNCHLRDYPQCTVRECWLLDLPSPGVVNALPSSAYLRPFSIDLIKLV